MKCLFSRTLNIFLEVILLRISTSNSPEPGQAILALFSFGFLPPRGSLAAQQKLPFLWSILCQLRTPSGWSWPTSKGTSSHRKWGYQRPILGPDGGDDDTLPQVACSVWPRCWFQWKCINSERNSLCFQAVLISNRLLIDSASQELLLKVLQKVCSYLCQKGEHRNGLTLCDCLCKLTFAYYRFPQIFA